MNEEIDIYLKEKFEILEQKGKGAYGIVWKVRDKLTKKIFALKKIFEAFQNSTDSQRTYREVMYLKGLNNYENIIKLYNIFKANNNRDLYLLFEYMETDLHIVIRAKILEEIHKKYVVHQLFKALKYMHSVDIIHRDLKPSNILINSDCLIKLADFGLARSINHEINKDDIVTENIATRWYRAPEILFQSKNYGKQVDVWSCGCILAEILLGKVLFNGSSSTNQIEMIVELLGKPTLSDIKEMNAPLANKFLSIINVKKKRNFSNLFANCNIKGVDLLKKILVYNPNNRYTIEQCLNHPYLAKFHNPNEVIFCENKININLKDSDKLTTKEYRNEIYKYITTCSKSEKEKNNLNLPNFKQIKARKQMKEESKQSNVSNKKTLTTKEKIYNHLEKKKEISNNKKIKSSKFSKNSVYKISDSKKSTSIKSTAINKSRDKINKIKKNPVVTNKKLSHVSMEKSRNIMSQEKIKKEERNFNKFLNNNSRVKKNINTIITKKKSNNQIYKKIDKKDSGIFKANSNKTDYSGNNFFKSKSKSKK